MTTPLASCCPKRHHSPRLVAGTGWSCPDCEQNTKPSPLAAAHAARDAGMARAATTSKIPDHERELFVSAVRQVARNGVVRQNDVRPLVRGRIYHKHIGALWSWAVTSGLLAELDREQSNDTTGRNTHHNAGVYRLTGAAA